MTVYTYIYIMSRRTQITFTDRQHALLVDESNRTGLSMAELVRRSVDRSLRPVSRRPLLGGYELRIGVWNEEDAAAAARARAPRKPRLFDGRV
jgi:hypothetical protein